MTCELFAFCANEIEIDLVDQVSNRGYGFQPHRFGSQYWTIKLSFPPKTDAQIREIEALKHLHESGVGNALCLYDIRRPLPASLMGSGKSSGASVQDDIDVFATGVTQVNVNGDVNIEIFGTSPASTSSTDIQAFVISSAPTITLVAASTADSSLTANVPQGFSLTAGDWVGYTDSDGRIWAHMLTKDVIGVGENTQLIVRPRPYTFIESEIELTISSVPIPMTLEFTPITATIDSGRRNTFSVSGYESVPVF